jgi:biopolymer transport protein ExbD
MAMAAANSENHLSNEINVTPMIDVLLVLLVIFMMIVPSARKAVDVQVPDPTPSVAPANAQSNQIVLEVFPNGQYSINTEKVSGAQNLARRLKEIYEPRPEKIIFVKGDAKIKYGEVIHAMDLARGAGVKVIGVPPKDTGPATAGVKAN